MRTASLGEPDEPPRLDLWLPLTAVGMVIAATWMPDPHRSTLGPAARAVGLSSTVVLSALLHQAWRASGSALLGRAAVATTLLALVIVFEMSAAMLGGEALVAARTGTSLAAAWFVVEAVARHEVDTTLRPVASSVRAMVAALALAALLAVADTTTVRLAVTLVALPALVWVGVSLHLTYVAWRRRRTVPRWLLWLGWTFVPVELARLLAPERNSDVHLTVSSVHAAALLSAIVAIGSLLRRTVSDTRDRNYLAGLTTRARCGPDDEATRTWRHDLSNSLCAVDGALRSLELCEPVPDPGGARARLRQAARSELERVRVLLAAQERGEPLPPGTGLVDLNRLVDEQALLTRATGHDVRIHGRAGPVHADPVATARILRNLLANAARHGADAEGHARIELHLADERTVATLVVRDHGPGIADTDQERVFESGWRGRSGRQGLGLHVARSLAREQGGDLRVVEVAGSGAAIELRLPNRMHPAQATTDHPEVGGDVRDPAPLPVPSAHHSLTPGPRRTPGARGDP